MSIVFNDKDFQRKTTAFVQLIVQRKQKAQHDVASEVLRLSQSIVPIGTEPGRKHQGATLQNSGSIEDYSEYSIVGYNTAYAAYQHEGQRKDGSHVVKHYSNSRSQKKFLENPIKDNLKVFKKYFEDILKK